MNSYFFSLPGIRHIEKNIPCQDVSEIVKLGNDWLLAAVADGVSSAARSEEGAAAAVKAVVSFMQKQFCNQDIFELERLIKEAYLSAWNEIEIMSEDTGIDIEFYDTTLTCVLYDGQRIVYGHVGDGAIIGLLNTGEYIAVTIPQKGDDGYSVIPLRAGAEYWIFGSYDGPFCSVMLNTDGIYESLFAVPLLKLQPQHLFIPALEEYMNIKQLQTHGENMEEICIYHKTRLSEDQKFKKLTDDDKTIAVMINDSIIPACMKESYYEEPDWDKLLKKQNSILYSSEQAVTTDKGNYSIPNLPVRVLVIGNDIEITRNLQYELNENGYLCDSVVLESRREVLDCNYGFIFCIWDEYLMNRKKVREMLSLLLYILQNGQIVSGILVTFGKEKTLLSVFRQFWSLERAFMNDLKMQGIHFERFSYPRVFGQWFDVNDITKKLIREMEEILERN